jgi:hypothetical protein
VCMQALQNFWLSVWSTRVLTWPAEGREFPTTEYLAAYFAIGAAAIVVQFFSGWVLVVATLNASSVRLTRLR